jgi:hypothetical protein
MDEAQRPAHSPLGASSAERWMTCSGSVALVKSLQLPEETDEPEYRSHGTSAHAGAAHCLENKLDAWEIKGQKFAKHEIDNDMVDAIQIYLDECNRLRTLHEGLQTVYIEHAFDAPEFHELFYGTCDFGLVTGDTLYVRDFKYGAGIAIEPETPQIKYYAYGVLRRHPEIKQVDLGIVQPRAFYPGDKVIRTITMSADELRDWAEGTLKPAMERTSLDLDLVPGPHCRFCPAKLGCPVLKSLFEAAATADPDMAIHLTNDDLGRQYPLIEVVKFYVKALEKETLARWLRGSDIPNTKMVHQKANRVYKPEAEEVFKKTIGPEAYTKPALKSPAEMEKISAVAKALVQQNAFTPQTGFTVALATDKRLGVKITSNKEAFEKAAATLEDE